VRNDDGSWTCLGRTDDVLKVGGIWVSPTEVETRLLEHPDLAEAAGVGGPDRDGHDRWRSSRRGRGRGATPPRSSPSAIGRAVCRERV